MKRLKIKQHEDLLTDPRYRQRVEKNRKVVIREAQDREALQEIQSFVQEYLSEENQE